VQEVLRYLVEEGIVVREDGRYQVRPGDAQSPENIPEGLRDVVGKRLSHLGEIANQVLSVAAVVGREFRLDVLQAVLTLPEDDLYAALEEAQARAIIEQHQAVGAVGFRFTHAFFRQTLYEEIFTPRRIRMHQQVGRALETVHARRLEDHAAELAEHFSQSVDSEDLTKAVRYGKLAGERAMSVFDYGEAAARLRQALRAQDVLDADDLGMKCDLLLGIGEAILALNQQATVLSDILPEAFAYAESLNDEERARRACLLALECLIGPVTEHHEVWRKRTERYAASDVRTMIRLMRSRGGTLVQRGYEAASVDILRDALRLSRELGDANDEVGVSWLLIHTHELDPQEEDQLIADANRRATENVSVFNRITLALAGALSCLSRGDTRRAEDFAQALALLAERSRHVRGLSQAEYFKTLLGSLRGNFKTLDPTGRADWTVIASTNARLCRWQGIPFETPPQIVALPKDQAAELRTYIAQVLKLLSLLSEGLADEAMATYSELRPRVTAEIHLIGVRNQASMLDLALLIGDKEGASAAYGALKSRENIQAFFYQNPMTADVALLMGKAAHFLEDTQAARRHFEAAVLSCQEMNNRPELALAHLSLAEVLLEHYPDEHDAAIEHLDFAIAALRDMKMQPALEQALRHRGLLKA